MSSAAEVKPPEFEPPQACVNRVIKAVLPESVQVTKDARAAFTRASGIFIFYLTHCANDFAKENKRQTIYPQDVMEALKELDFDDLIEPLNQFLVEYRKENDTKKKSKKTNDDTKGPKSDDAKEEEDDEEEDGEEDQTAVNIQESMKEEQDSGAIGGEGNVEDDSMQVDGDGDEDDEENDS